MLSEIEAGRADEVADVFDEQQIEPLERQVVQRLVHQVRIEMTGRSRRDLQCRHALRADAGRIVVGFQVAFDDRDTVPVAKRHDGGLQ